MSFEMEFETVALLERSKAETRAVDAFALSFIKSERQLRRLFTYLVYQYPCFSYADANRLREILAASRRVFADGFVTGFDAIYPNPIASLIGPKYVALQKSMTEATAARHKIFHGQLTGGGLSREALWAQVADIKEWCRLLSSAAKKEIGYDGFARDSFRKSQIPRLHERFKIQLKSATEYEEFVERVVTRA